MRTTENFGVEKIGAGKTIVVDYGGPNVAKPLHIGHLRSAIIGESIKRLYKFFGYNTIGEITLVVTFDADEKTFSYVWSGAVSGTTDTIEVVNQAGSTLPETGGIGTTLFYVFGGIMVLGAAVLLVTKKRMTA